MITVFTTRQFYKGIVSRDLINSLESLGMAFGPTVVTYDRKNDRGLSVLCVNFFCNILSYNEAIYLLQRVKSIAIR